MGILITGTSYSSIAVTNTGNLQPGLPVPTSIQTIKKAYGTFGGGGATMYTVTNGKTFYCTGLNFGRATAAVGSVNIVVDLPGGTILSFTCPATIGEQVNISGGIIFSATSAQAITVTTAGTGTFTFSIWGFEQ